MDDPFIYGKIAEGAFFTDREEETLQLCNNFNSLISTILISPRRWGKSSLVKRAAEVAEKQNKSLVFCFLDLYNVRTEEEFYNFFTKEILKATASKAETILEYAKKFLSRIVPVFSFSPELNSEFSLSFDFIEIKKYPHEILNLAENIAAEKKIRIVICIDEFQNISGFEDPLAFQKKLRSSWQKHKYATYCLYGSKRHMLMDVFTSPSMPFYKFGDLIFLQKIEERHWITFIKERFAATGKKIAEEVAVEVARKVECHPYYAQQLAQQAWLRTKNSCNVAIVEEAFESLVLQLSMLFQSATDQLSNTQVNFLKALLSEVSHLSSKSVLQEYNLGTSANVQRIKQALIDKEIVDFQSSSYDFIDPLYKYWLKKYYFKIKI